jgi:hypothetical protein
MGTDSLFDTVLWHAADPVVERLLDTDQSLIPTAPSALLVEPSVLDDLEVQALLTASVGPRTPNHCASVSASDWCPPAVRTVTSKQTRFGSSESREAVTASWWAIRRSCWRGRTTSNWKKRNRIRPGPAARRK